MKSLKVLVLAIVMTLSSCVSHQPRRGTDWSRANLIESLSNSTVALVSPIPHIDLTDGIRIEHRGYRSYCSGVFIDHVHILTAAHCVDDVNYRVRRKYRQEPEVIPEDVIIGPVGQRILFSTRQMFNDESMKITDSREATVVRYDLYKDLALLRVNGEQEEFSRESLHVLRNTSTLYAGQEVWAMGHPQDLMWNLTGGFISQVQARDRLIGRVSRTTTAVTLFVYFGNSGGPLIDERGNVIGIASLIRFDGNMSYFVNAMEINKFLRTN